MNNVKRIRLELGVTQDAMAKGMGCTQGNVSFYEKGQTVPPAAADSLITFAGTKGMTVTYNDIYGPERDYVPPPVAPVARPSALAGINLVSPQAKAK